jgi:hypothetical protein
MNSLSARSNWLAAQALSLGAATSWVVVPGNAIFLDRYGSDLLPVTYIAAAAGGAATTVAISASLRSRPIVAVASRALGATAVMLLAAWVLLLLDVTPVVFGVLTLAPLMVPVGMMFVLGEAGRLLDVRALKSLYGRVVAGFAFGFVAGGLSAPVFVTAFGESAHLLLLAAGAIGAFIVALRMTRRRYLLELTSTEDHAGGAAVARPAAVMRNRYVLLIIAYQVLSAVESQLLDFLVFDRAARRYDDTEQLAAFIGRFTAITYAVDIVFLTVLAGWLLRRYGVGFGLAANPIGVIAALSGVIVASLSQSAGATGTLALVVGGRAADIVLCDGMVRPSISAAYQAIPARLRGVTQTVVEGFAVPVAIGASGAVLLVVSQADATDGIVIPVLTIGVVLCWIAVAVALQRAYGHNLLLGLRRRTLVASELVVDTQADRSLVRQLLDSDHVGDVRLALDVLASNHDPELEALLTELVESRPPGVQLEALERLRARDPKAAAAVGRQLARDADGELRSATMLVLARHGEADDLALLRACMDDPVPATRIAANMGVLRLGSEADADLVDRGAAALSRSTSVADRVAAAGVAGLRGPSSAAAAVVDRLLNDDDAEVVIAALAAVARDSIDLRHGRVVELLQPRRTGQAAMAALARSHSLDRIADSLDDERLTSRQHRLLIRACRLRGGADAVALLGRQVLHRDRGVGLEALRALSSWGEPGTEAAIDHRRFVEREVADARRLLVAMRLLDPDQVGLVGAALAEDLELTRNRLWAWLGLRFGAEGVGRVGWQLRHGDVADHATALEWLDVTLGSDRAVLAILDPTIDVGTRDRLVGADTGSAVPAEIIDEVLVGATWARPWARACAVHAAWIDPQHQAALDAVGVAVGAGTEDDLVADTWRSLERRHSTPHDRR